MVHEQKIGRNQNWTKHSAFTFTFTYKMSTIYDNMTGEELKKVCQNHKLPGYSAKDPVTGKVMNVDQLRQWVKDRLAPTQSRSQVVRAQVVRPQVSRSQVSSMRPQASGISSLGRQLASSANIKGHTIDSETIINATPTQLRDFVKDLDSRQPAATPNYGMINSKTMALQMCKEQGHNGPMEEYVMALYGYQNQEVSRPARSVPRQSVPRSGNGIVSVSTNEAAAARLKKFNGLNFDFSASSGRT